MLVGAYFNLGVLQTQGPSRAAPAERFARAAAFFEKAAALDPDFPGLQGSWGVACFNAGQFDKATGPLARAVGANPSDAGLQRLLALAYINTHAYEKAVPLLEKDTQRETDASLQSAYGMSLLRSGRAADAERVLAGLLETRGESAELLVLLGQAQADQKKWDKALVSLSPGPRAGQERGGGGGHDRPYRSRETEEGEPVRTVAIALSMLLLAPSARPQSAAASVKALVQLARTQMGQKNAALAMQTLGKALPLAPNSEEVLSAYAEAALAARAPVKALPALEALGRLAPTEARYRTLMGQALLMAGDAEAATPAFEEAERLDPRDTATLVGLGTALNRRGLFADANAVLLRASTLDPDAVSVLAARAEAEAGLGEGTPPKPAPCGRSRDRAGTAPPTTSSACSGSDRAVRRSAGSAREGGRRPSRLPRRAGEARRGLRGIERRARRPQAPGPGPAAREGARGAREGGPAHRRIHGVGRERAVTRGLALGALLLAASSPAQAPNEGPRLYRDVTAEAGIDFVHHAAPDKKYIVESMSGGVALFDFDQDGLLDIYLTDSLTVDTANDPKAARSALYRNKGSWKFEDVTARAGVGHPGWAMGVCTADVDADGWPDLYVTALNKNVLYRNNRDGTFTDVAEKVGLRGRLVGGLRLRRLRPRRRPRPLRQPLREGGPREPSGVREGQDLHVPRDRGAVRPARPSRRDGLPLPPGSGRALHGGERGRRGRRPARALRAGASPGSTSTATAGRTSTWPTTPAPTTSTRTARTARSRRSASRWGSR